MFASAIVWVVCIGLALVLAAVVLVLVLLSQRGTKKQPDPWLDQQGPADQHGRPADRSAPGGQ